MTTQEKNNYSAKHIRRMILFERQHLPAIIAALRIQIKPVAAKLRSHGVEAAIASLDVFHINSALAKPIQNIYTTVGLYFANKTIHDINQSAKEVKAGFGFNAEFLREIITFFSRYLLNLAVLPISETQRQLILSVLSQGLTDGKGAEELAREIEGPELTLRRARLIVRTESNKAMNYGQRLGESKSEWESTKTWVDAKDNRERASHKRVGSTVLDTKEKFHVPILKKVGSVEVQLGMDYMDGPGDTHASAGNICNCRCVLAFRAKRDGNGRLIRKPNNTLTSVNV